MNKSVAWLDNIEVQFTSSQESKFVALGRKREESNKIAFNIDTEVDTFNREKSNNQHVVLVHCAMGRSRSASCVIMYIMKKFGVRFDDVFEFVKSRRE